MAFKSFSQYQEDKNGDFFTLSNDGDYADVIFLYRSVEDVLVADVHYISSASYKGYAHCCGRNEGCPACHYPTQSGRGIRVDTKIFIPLLNLSKNKIEFWDRSTYFEKVLQKQVFSTFPNPSETVFRITRHGEGREDTRYEIMPVGRNSSMPYEKICADFNVTFPDSYSIICREMSVSEMSECLNATQSAANLEDYGYVPVPRGESAEVSAPEVTVPTPEYSAPPEVAPPSDGLPEYDPNNVVESATEVSSNDAEDSDLDDSLDDVKF